MLEDSCPPPLRLPLPLPPLGKILQINTAEQVMARPIHLLSGVCVMAAEELEGSSDNQPDRQA